jgi:hypothetical protein
MFGCYKRYTSLSRLDDSSTTGVTNLSKGRIFKEESSFTLNGRCQYYNAPYTYTKQNIWIRIMEFNATSNNILFISWLSVLLVEKTGLSGENHRWPLIA